MSERCYIQGAELTTFVSSASHRRHYAQLSPMSTYGNALISQQIYKALGVNDSYGFSQVGSRSRRIHLLFLLLYFLLHTFPRRMASSPT